MVHHGRHRSRPLEESQLFNSTVVPWRHIVNVLARNDTVDRVGTFPAPMGWIWVNFFWVRASHVQKLSEPIRTTRRHYYEDWLGRLYDPSTENDTEPGKFEGCERCYSFNGNCSGFGITYLPDTVHHCAAISLHSRIAYRSAMLQ